MIDRILLPRESHPCFVGSGECLINAAYEMDDGAGGKVYICIPHKLEFERIEKLVSEMSPEQMAQFEAAIKKAERKQ